MSHFISSEQLKSQLGKVVIFDCRFNLMNKTMGSEQYRAGHIPGAYYLDLEKDLSSAADVHGGRHPLPDVETLSQTLRAAGVNQHSTIVVYDNSRMAYAARAWWLLRFYGHEDVLILDGGFAGWVNSGNAIDRREPSPKSGNFKATIPSGWTANRDEILQAGAAYTLIDSREAKRYRGDEEPIDPVAGHIPNALNYFWQDATTEQGFIKSDEEQLQRWDNLNRRDNLVVYCGSGVTACVNILSLEMSGIPAKLYPGSWSDWCSYLPPTDKG
jgi:thiosulfate/3-mercaptopyruvate sulfurtransferase